LPPSPPFGTLCPGSAIVDSDEYYKQTRYSRANDFYGYKGRTDGVEDILVNYTAVEGLWKCLREDRADLGGGRVGVGEEGIEKLEVFVGDYEGKDHVELVGGLRGTLAQRRGRGRRRRILIMTRGRGWIFCCT